MAATDPSQYHALRTQIQLQQKHGWDLEKDIHWQQPIHHDRYLLPLDAHNIVFPGLSSEQRLALSQWLGLVINTTISEMENVITNLKELAWQKTLDRYPINPEMKELGELFFEEEGKHAKAFAKYNQLFIESCGLQDTGIQSFLPQAFGTSFLAAIVKNAKDGGHAFWWVVSGVEEVSIDIYRQMHPHRDLIEPLFFEVHHKHMEEEARHKNYAFLMLELIYRPTPSLKERFHRKMDLMLAQWISNRWVLTELAKIYKLESLKVKHPFIDTLKSCLPILKKQSLRRLASQLFTRAPYLSYVLNLKNQPQTYRTARQRRVPHFWLPTPESLPTDVK